jgi:hypothetical protein
VRSAWSEAHALGLAHVAAGRAELPPSMACGGAPLLERRDGLRRHEQLLVELAGPFLPEWAGHHCVYPGTLHVAPAAGAVWTERDCSGVVEVHFGDVVAWTHDTLRVRWRTAVERSPSDSRLPAPRPLLTEAFFLVWWGRERFLLSSAMLVPFCNGVNGGDPLIDLPGLRWERGRDPSALERPHGVPQMPRACEPFLLAAPLEGLLLEVDEPVDDGRDFLKIQARASLGARDGLLPGMLLHALDLDARGTAEVLAVEPLHATVELRYHRDAPLAQVPQAGWRMSTRRRGL